jgi:cobalt transporter subunit CbtB
MYKHLTKSPVSAASDTTAQRRAIAAMGLLFGIFLILGVGFAHSETIHNAAHDSRHSFAFPCH